MLRNSIPVIDLKSDKCLRACEAPIRSSHWASQRMLPIFLRVSSSPFCAIPSPASCCGMLLRIPTELLQEILHNLSRSTLTRLCLVNRQAYQLCLPVLYAHLELSFRCHIRQLDWGIQHRPFLRETIEQHTKQLTLVCRQSGSFVTELQYLLSRIPKVRILTFSDFHVLPVEIIRPLANVLPQLQQLNFKYCNLVSKDQQTNGSEGNDCSVFKSTSTLSFFWTDFSESAIRKLLSGFPNLCSVEFGANHNRIHTANDSALKILREHCLDIRDLSVSLQQVAESTLCEVIAFYGPQLRRLSIRCDGPRTLTTVATHAIHVQDLSVRAVGGPWMGTHHNHQQHHQQQQHSQRRQQQHQQQHQHQLRRQQFQQGMQQVDDEAAEDEIEGSMMGILKRCQRLVHLELACWMIQDVPGIVWRAIETVAKRRTEASKNVVVDVAGGSGKCDADHHRIVEIQPVSDTNGGLWLYYLDDQVPRGHNGLRRRPIGNIKKTLALDIEELREIRKQFLSSPSTATSP